MATQASTAKPQSRSMLADIVDSIFTPGTNSGLIRAMDMSFYALFAVLVVMVVLTRGNGHICALFALSVGLFASIKWCVGSCDVRVIRVASSSKLGTLCRLTPFNCRQVLGPNCRSGGATPPGAVSQRAAARSRRRDQGRQSTVKGLACACRYTP
jgi:hypothetical protein